jgi:hypothetical protein
MLRIHYLQKWFGLSDPAMEEALHDVPLYREIVKLDASGGWRELPVNLGSWGDGGMWSTLDDLVRAKAHWLDAWRRHGAGSLLERCAAEDARFGPVSPVWLRHRGAAA